MKTLMHNISISKAMLIRANEESIRLGFNRNLQGIESLPDQIYNISQAFSHTGFNGAECDNHNFRLLVWLVTKRFDDPTLSEQDMHPVTLDVTADTLDEIVKRHRRRLRKNRSR
jgi:hypothetical protein